MIYFSDGNGCEKIIKVYLLLKLLGMIYSVDEAASFNVHFSSCFLYVYLQ
jgi:hypothetical protein